MNKRVADSEQLKKIHRLATLMDEAFTIPGTKIRVGLDSIVGLVPGIGDSIGLATTGYIVLHSYRYGVRKRVLARMVKNAGVDFIVGSIPVLGDIFDVYYKAHRRNADLLDKELARMAAPLNQR